MNPEITWDAISTDLVEQAGLSQFEAEDFLRSSKTVRIKVAEGRMIGFGSVDNRAFEIDYAVRVGP
jgi:hypothetical protein